MFDKKLVLRCAVLSPPVAFLMFSLAEYWLDMAVLGFWGMSAFLFGCLHATLVCAVNFSVGRMARRKLMCEPLSEDDRRFADATVACPLLWSVVPIMGVLLADAKGALAARTFLFGGGMPVFDFAGRWLGGGATFATLPVAWAEIDAVVPMRARAIFALLGTMSLIGPWAAMFFGAFFPSKVYEKDVRL